MKVSSCLCLVLAAHVPQAAGRDLRQAEQAVVNFGFATQLGSGIYSVAGRTLQVYRLPFAYTPPRDEASPYSLRITAPVTFGLLDFQARDVLESGLPQHVDTYSFVPGLELDIALTERWTLQPFAEAGIARDRDADIDQRVYSLGLRGRYDFARGPVDWQGYSEIVRVVVDQRATDERDDFTRLRVGATARRPFELDGPERRPDFLVYGFAEAFTDAPAGPAGEVDASDELQFEAGVTFGATRTLHLWRIPLPRVGLGYRFDLDGLAVYRLVFGSPY